MTVDLSRLDPPDVVEALDYDGVLAAMMADYQARHPAFTAWVESEPALKLLEVAAYRETLLRNRINDAARGVMLAFAGGTDLDHLVALFGVARAAGEADDALRRRMLLSYSSQTTAGSRMSYEFHARSADSRVSDAAAIRTAPGEVTVVIFGEGADGIPSAPVIAAVRSALDDDTVRPLTDTVTVRSIEILPYRIDATLTVGPGPDRDVVVGAARTALEGHVRARRVAGGSIHRAALIAAAVVPGVVDVELAAPPADVVAGALQAPWCTSGGGAAYTSPTTHPLDGIAVAAA